MKWLLAQVAARPEEPRRACSHPTRRRITAFVFPTHFELNRPRLDRALGHRPAWSGDVRVAMEGAPAPGEYSEVGIVNASGTAQDATLPAVLKALQT